MKRRIISLLLVVVMLTLTLVGCGYSYAKDDMEQYTEFDKAAFLAALQELEIADGEFTTDEATREIKVLDSIYEALAKTVDADEKVSEGKPGEYDILYYVYYCTGVKDEVTYTFYANKMKESGASKLQLGLSDLSDLDAKIAAAIIALDSITDYAYKTTTEGNTEAGDTVYISYTRRYTVDAAEGGGTETKTESYKYVKLELGSSDGNKFADKLVGKEIGKEIDLDDATISEQIGGAAVDVSYSDITVHWVVDEGDCISFKHTPYTSSTKVAPAEPYTADSGKIDLKDMELTYYVYPVYYNEVSELSATSVLKEIFGKNLSESSLPMFSDEAYKTLVGELGKLLSELADLEKTLKTKTEDYEKKKAIVDAAESPTQAQTNAMNNAKSEMDTAQTNVNNKNTDIDAKITAIFAVDTDTEGEGNLNTEGNIVKEYKKSVYDSLEAKYNSEIKYSLATKIYNLIEENVKVTSLPEKAVDNAYDILIDSYKETFYTGTDSKTDKTNYALYNGDFKSFLKDQTGASDYAGAKDKVREEAEAAVKPIVQIYAAAQALDSDDAEGKILYTDKEYDENVKNTNLGTYEDYYGEVNIKAAEQIDKLLNYYLEMDEEHLVEVESDHDHEDGEEHEHEKKPEYVDGKIVYVRIKYSIKEDATETE